MKIHLVSSTWTTVDLNERRIEFRLRLEDGIKEGVGMLWARDCPDNLLSVSIVCDVPIGQFLGARIRIPIPQEGIDLLKVHPDPTIARFQLLGV